MGIVIARDGSTVYVSNGRGGTVSVIDAARDSVLSTVPAGLRPWGIALSLDGRWLYTANGPGNDLSVIDTKTMEVVHRIPVGESPWGVAIGPKP
jgi:YVTN family beta-propeller protein